jgi:hypothetical protein
VAWWYAVVEAEHELQNPTSAEKIRLLGKRMRLGPDSQVLDVASGKAGPAIVLAREFGCRITCVERAAEFHEQAVERVQAAGLDGLIELVHGDAAAFPIEPGRWDAAMCLGASFVWHGLDPTLAALAPGVRDGGSVAVGEPYWRAWPLPDAFEPDEGDDFLELEPTVERFSEAGLEPVALIDGSQDDWDRYESLHWLALAEWLGANPEDTAAEEFRARGARHRERYLRWERDLLGWAIIVGRRR